MDVKSELQAHFDDKIAAGRAAGLSELESRTLALKSFGDIVTIADSLAAANIPRMKLKARLWHLATVLLIPGVIICVMLSLTPIVLTLGAFDDFENTFSLPEGSCQNQI